MWGYIFWVLVIVFVAIALPIKIAETRRKEELEDAKLKFYQKNS